MKVFGLHGIRVVRLLLGAWMASLLAVSTAAAQALDPHAFEIRSGSVSLRDGTYVLDADIDFKLSRSASDALESGVPLSFELQIELVRPRKLWLDDEVATLVQRFRVRYHALSQRYVLTNLNTSDSESYSTREGAMRALGTIRSLPVIDQRLLREHEEYQLWLRAGLDVDELPPPLKTGAYLSPQWRLLSEWHVWRFNT